MDLVEVEPVTEQLGGLGALPLVGGEAVVLDLVRLGVGAPVRRVGVTPLAADHDVVDVGTGAEPVGEELLGAAVRAGHVVVAHALGVGGVEEFVGALTQGVDAAYGREVVLAAEVDVAGAAHRGQAEPDVRGGSRG